MDVLDLSGGFPEGRQPLEGAVLVLVLRTVPWWLWAAAWGWLGTLVAWELCVRAERRVGSAGSLEPSPPGAEPPATVRKDWAGWDGATLGL